MLTPIKLFFRSVRRNKLFSFINILGLTVGFFSSILIYLYVSHETSYDTFHENGDEIYRINQTFIWGDDNPNLFSATGPGVGYAVREEIPEVQHVVRVFTAHDMLPITFLRGEEERFFNDEYVAAVDSNFLEVFTFPLLYGDKYTSLDRPGSVVLSYETAHKFFGDTDVVGKTLTMDNGELFKVTGVLQPLLKNSYLEHLDVLVSLSSIERMQTSDWNWLWTMFETYILLEETADAQTVQGKLDLLPAKHAGQTLKVMGYTYEEYVAAGKEWNLFMQPFTDIYLGSNNIYTILGPVGDHKIVAALIGSAIFLIILSCINFINLSTAQFTTRAQDVALRKVLGGSKMTFIMRFFGESFIYCIVSLVLAMVFVYYTIPFVNQSVGTDLSLSWSEHPTLLPFTVLLVIAVSAIAGFYPFIFFNAFKPIQAMKGEMKSGRKGVKLRNGMLVLQYVLSFLLIIGTITIYRQLDYFLHADLGFEQENLLTIEHVDWTEAQEEFANELGSLPGVMGTSVCDAVPMLISNGDQFTTDEPEAVSLPLNYTLADENYIDLLEIELLVGRGFEKSYASDTAAIILNETAVRSIGWSIDDAVLNKKITNWSGTYRVIGVCRDFNFWSLHTPIEPFAIFSAEANPNGGRPLTRVMVKYKGTQTDFEEVKSAMEEKWNDFVPHHPMEYTVLTDHISSRYETEERFGSMISFFSILTIIIASLGLFGIVVFTLEQKLKEIGVRKVLGASVQHLVFLFSKSYIRLVLIGFVIAILVSYYFMDVWLSDFEYRISIGVDIFIWALVALLTISLSISILQTARASSTNPAEVLKDE